MNYMLEKRESKMIRQTTDNDRCDLTWNLSVEPYGDGAHLN
jgi:hypothetical protein